jgi:hypothetical protein
MLAKRVADAASTTAPTARTSRHAPTPIAAPQAPDDFPAYRQRYVACQQAMEASIGPLRRRVRSTLAGATSALARLADLDAVMEQVVGAQERALLATVPGRLEQRFEHLRRAHADPDAADAPPAAWADTFRLDMRDVLLAELELRLQPVEGLLEALRQPPPDRPDRHE